MTFLMPQRWGAQWKINAFLRERSQQSLNCSQWLQACESLQSPPEPAPALCGDWRASPHPAQGLLPGTAWPQDPGAAGSSHVIPKCLHRGNANTKEQAQAQLWLWNRSLPVLLITKPVTPDSQERSTGEPRPRAVWLSPGWELLWVSQRRTERTIILRMAASLVLPHPGMGMSSFGAYLGRATLLLLLSLQCSWLVWSKLPGKTKKAGWAKSAHRLCCSRSIHLRSSGGGELGQAPFLKQQCSHWAWQGRGVLCPSSGCAGCLQSTL